MCMNEPLPDFLGNSCTGNLFQNLRKDLKKGDVEDIDMIQIAWLRIAINEKNIEMYEDAEDYENCDRLLKENEEILNKIIDLEVKQLLK